MKTEMNVKMSWRTDLINIYMFIILFLYLI